MNVEKNEWGNDRSISHAQKNNEVCDDFLLTEPQILGLSCLRDQLTDRLKNQSTNALEMPYRGAIEIASQGLKDENNALYVSKWMTTTKERISCARASNDEAALQTIQP